jgi:hypothetical protein
MSDSRGFDEVMIVNPYDPRLGHEERIGLMNYGEPSEYGYYGDPYGFGYAEPPDLGYYGDPPAAYGYGYYGEPPDLGWYGDYAEGPEVAGFAQGPDPFGYYAQPPEMSGYGGYGYPPGYGGYGYPGYGAYAEPADVAGYGGYGGYYGGYGEADPMFGYGQAPEMVGYSNYHEYEPLSESPEYGACGEPDFAGYVRTQRRPPWNPGCPAPTNVSGFGEPPLEGYGKPRGVNPVVKQFDPQPPGTAKEPETFRPLW